MSPQDNFWCSLCDFDCYASWQAGSSVDRQGREGLAERNPDTLVITEMGDLCSRI